MAESWHSFDDMNWYEAEAVIQEDVATAEVEADNIVVCGTSACDEQEPKNTGDLCDVDIRDTAYGTNLSES